jgi:uncharacterized membrane protein YedE/YeeE
VRPSVTQKPEQIHGEFYALPAFCGGALIGLSAVLLLLTNGRIAGISGVVGGLLGSKVRDAGWRLAFIVGLIAAPLLYAGAAGGCRRSP